MERSNKPRRGRPPKSDKSNANIALRLRPDERKQITGCAELMGMSPNAFMVQATLAIVGQVNGTIKGTPDIVKIGEFPRELKK